MGMVRPLLTTLAATLLIAQSPGTATLSWRGTARIHAGDQPIDIGVSTHVVPFVSARSESWLLSEGPGSTRVMTVDRDGGWMERGGRREPMPDSMLVHERQQYAIYGLMLLARRLDPSMMESIAAPPGMTAVRVRHPEAPVTDMIFDGEGRLVEARNRVGDPEGGGEIDQVFRFSGEIEDDGVRWPRRIDILQR